MSNRASGLRVLLLCSLAAGILWLIDIDPATAATFVVTTASDSNDGACTVALCSLRDAVIAANANAGADIITLPVGTYTLTIAGTGEDAAATGDLDITDSVTINGAGATTTIIDGGAIDRVFEVLGGTVAFNDLTIRNGLLSSQNGAGMLVSGGTVAITRCIISANTANSGDGGGIYTSRAMTITDSTINGNAAPFGDGGGLNADGLVTLTGSTVSGNTATNGDGGGIYVFFELNMTNSTVSGNSAFDGGGLYNDDTVTILNSTIANNSAANVGGGIDATSSLTITNTIIANNTGGNCTGTVINGGTNLQFPGTTCGVAIPAGDPVLGPLADNGGSTQTHALLAGSAAIDAGTTGCPPTPASDQRGVARPQGSACDVGAFEVQGPAPLPTLSINNVSENEGNSGITPFVFTVTLSAPSASPVTVNFATADGTASSASDYITSFGMLTFAPGVTTQTITVNVGGDTTPEADETFFVNLGAPANATIAAGTGTGTIVNDDGGVAPPPPQPSAPVPTLTDWALVALAAMLLGSAMLMLRRRRR